MIRIATLAAVALMAMDGMPRIMSTTPTTPSTQSPSNGVPGAGVPLTLADERARRVSDLRYDLHFSIPADQKAPIAGRIRIAFTLSDASRPLALDFAPGRITTARSGNNAVTLEASPDHLVVPSAALRSGANEITIEFDAGEQSLNRNPEFLYTLFVPARAHLAFPCFDQPNLKARWTLALDIPTGWQALANGAELERQEANGRISLKFAETPPLSTYLFAFAAGRFSVESGERAGRAFRLFHRENDAAKVARNRDQIFDLHAAALGWLERYTGIPYPWGKFDFLLVPSFQFGGMEHPGAIFYNASGLFLDPSATQNQKLGRASVIAHETAHMWFGDLVTMRWFNDVWMKEVFANFMAAKIVNPSFPEINHELRFLLAHYPSAYDIDRTPGTNAIRQQLDNLNEAGSLYGAIIYQKAPIVMRQLEAILGEAPFKAGLQEYLKAHSFANASWADLIALLDARTPEDLAAWSRAWVEEAGRPMIATDLRIENGRIASLAFTQQDPIKARGLTWSQRLQVTIDQPDGPRTIPVRLNAGRVEVSEAKGLAAPRYVLPSGGGIGYGAFELDPRSLTYLHENLPAIEDALTRGAAWITLWEEMLARPKVVDAPVMVELALQALRLERDEQNVQRILNDTEDVYWSFLSAEDRSRYSPRLERVLRAGLDASTTASLKSAWFSALRDTARSPETVAWLERVWRKQESVPGLILAEPDYINLSLQLAVREVPAWQEILEQQAGRIENPDRRQRFQFVRPALAADPSVRDAFVAQLTQPAARAHEAWVLEGLGFVHHPLRAASAEKYIPGSLAMLREIQRTGDIFFPKRWMDATLGGHSSASAALMVQRFLAELPPDYPDRLRRVILSSSDRLFRASGVAR